MGSEVWGLGFWVGLRFEVWGLGFWEFGIWGVMLGVWGWGLRA